MDLNQITLEAADFDASVAFYTRLGLKLIVLSDARYARFELPSGATTLSLHHAASPNIGNTVLYFEVDDIAARFHSLTAAGIIFDTEPKMQRYRWIEARFRDPAGNLLCLFQAGPERRFPPWRLEPAGHIETSD